jgi:hypothetical protein
MADTDGKPSYKELEIPHEALARGGDEILRAGLVDDALFVTARPAFDDPGSWGEILGEITRRIANLFAEGGRFTHKDALAAIAGAYAAELGAPVIREPSGRERSARGAAKSGAKSRTKSAKTRAAGKTMKKPAKTSAKRKR